MFWFRRLACSLCCLPPTCCGIMLCRTPYSLSKFITAYLLNENCHHLLTHILYQTCMTSLFLWNRKGDILMNVFAYTMKTKRIQNFPGLHWLLLYWQKKKKSSIVFHRRRVWHNMRVNYELSFQGRSV